MFFSKKKIVKTAQWCGYKYVLCGTQWTYIYDKNAKIVTWQMKNSISGLINNGKYSVETYNEVLMNNV